MTYVKHAPCPNCGSRDNLAIYADHEYCFGGCGYIKFYNYHDRRIDNIKDTDQKIVSLPEDIVSTIPAVADSWVRKYGLTLQELYDNRVVWSDFRKLLIFPYFDDKGHLWGWQGRYFGTDSYHPKWTGKGNFKERIKIYSPKDLTSSERNSIILIEEDIISTIKTSRIYNSTCIYGSHIDINKYIKIYNIYKPKSFCIWLDADKRKEALLYSLSFNKIGIPCSTIYTEKDPKEYTTSEIRTIIDGNQN